MRISKLFFWLCLACLIGWLAFISYQAWQTPKSWVPKISIFIPRFMYQERATPSHAVQTNDIPLPQESIRKHDELYPAIRTSLDLLTPNTSLINEKNAALKYGKSIALDPTKPRIAVVVSHFGLSEKVKALAFSILPDTVTLAFSPHATNLKTAVSVARSLGFETMLNLPIQTDDFPNYDSGENAIYAHASEKENRAVKEHLLRSDVAITGFVVQNASELDQTDMFNQLKHPGFIYLTSNIIDVDAHQNTYREALQFYFDQAKKTATQKGSAVIILPPSPLVFKMLNNWMHDETDVQFVPVSMLYESEKK